MKCKQTGHIMWKGKDVVIKAGEDIPNEMLPFIRYKKPMMVGFENAWSIDEYQKWLRSQKKVKKEEVKAGKVKLEAREDGSTEQYVSVKNKKTKKTEWKKIE